jgi:hypothetical protein
VSFLADTKGQPSHVGENRSSSCIDFVGSSLDFWQQPTNLQAVERGVSPPVDCRQPHVPAIGRRKRLAEHVVRIAGTVNPVASFVLDLDVDAQASTSFSNCSGVTPTRWRMEVTLHWACRLGVRSAPLVACKPVVIGVCDFLSLLLRYRSWGSMQIHRVYE